MVQTDISRADLCLTYEYHTRPGVIARYHTDALHDLVSIGIIENALTLSNIKSTFIKFLYVHIMLNTRLQ